MSDARTRVVKVGGSLLELPELAEQLRAWLARQAPGRNLFIAGGGGFVDELRALDDLHHLGDETCHWLAIHAMSLTARFLSALVPEWWLVASLRELADSTSGSSGLATAAAILEPLEFLRADEATGDPLPHSWAVTSDSIAARAANLIRQSGQEVELVLLKSSLPPAGCDAVQAAACGYVDAYFPRAARGLNVVCIDLRDPEFPCRRL